MNIGEVQMRTQSSTIDIRSLELFQAMYVVGLAFGILEISSSLYLELRDVIFFDGRLKTLLVHGSLFFAILLLIVRFFWSVGNIRRAAEDATTSQSVASTRWVVLFHLPALLIQGVLVLFVSSSFADLVAGFKNSLNPIFWFILVTAWNAFWLTILIWKRTDGKPEIVWIRNNSVLACIGIFLVVLKLKGIISDIELILIFSMSSVLSSIIDLWITANYYISDTGR